MNAKRFQIILTQKNVASLMVNVLLMLLICLTVFKVETAGAQDNPALKYKMEASYTMGPGDSKALAHKLALFRAKRKAAERAAHDFARRKLIQFENGDQNELVALVAENLTYFLLVDKWQSNQDHRTYIVDIQSEVKLSDFIDAQLTILKMRHKKVTDNFRMEMEPSRPEFLKPGRALAKAYWLIRIGEYRMAIIYLDAMTKQYPNWKEAYDVRKIAKSEHNRVGGDEHSALLNLEPKSVPFQIGSYV